MFDKFILKVGDDVKYVKWMEVLYDIYLYVNYYDMVKEVVRRFDVFW